MILCIRGRVLKVGVGAFAKVGYLVFKGGFMVLKNGMDMYIRRVLMDTCKGKA